MSHTPKHHRRSIRLPGYDYTSSGAYFVTICIHGGACVLGDIAGAEMHLNEWGRIVHEEWMASQEIRTELVLDAFVVMPNHLHGIVWIDGGNDLGAHSRAPVQTEGGTAASFECAPRSLGSFVAGYKGVVTKRINALRGTPGAPFWQRNYWEHIIRNDASLDRIREYIEMNPARWELDQLHPAAPPNRFNRWQP